VILFLDFDGVLHGNDAGLELNVRDEASLQSLTDEQRRFITRDGRLIVGENLFGHADRLAVALEPYPDVRIVITSTWRIYFELEALQRFLPPALAGRVIGITPQVFSRDGVSQRVREIDAYFRKNDRGLEPWIALDDHDWPFISGGGVSPYLILLDGKEGFTDAAAVVLRQRLREEKNPNNRTTSKTCAIPTSGLNEYIIGLARQHGVKYVKTSSDELAEVITRLADDNVEMDEVELLLIALERAGVITSEQVVPLHVNYLQEKLNDLPEDIQKE